MSRGKASLWTRRQSIRYARWAVTAMKADDLPIGSIDTRMVRMLIATAQGSDDQRRHIYGGLSRFLAWCVQQELIEVNPCDRIAKRDRPGPGRARSHVPSIDTLKAIWAVVEDEDELARSLIRFMLLLPLRRSEVAGLLWSEVLPDRIRIGASCTKNHEAHELPLPPAALAILEARNRVAVGKLVGEGDLDRSNQYSLHDNRRAFVSHLAGQFDENALDQCLGHVRSGVAGIYQRSQRWPDRVRALNAWADLITGTESATNVVSLNSVKKVI